MKCAFHAYDGPAPCPHCYEAQTGYAFTVRPEPSPEATERCQYCQSVDIRSAETEHAPAYTWCGQCGKRRHET